MLIVDELILLLLHLMGVFVARIVVTFIVDLVNESRV